MLGEVDGGVLDSGVASEERDSGQQIVKLYIFPLLVYMSSKCGR